VENSYGSRRIGNPRSQVGSSSSSQLHWGDWASTTGRTEEVQALVESSEEEVEDERERKYRMREQVCNSISSCTSCVSASYYTQVNGSILRGYSPGVSLDTFGCRWCIQSHICVHVTGTGKCRFDMMVEGTRSVGPSIRRGPEFCNPEDVTTSTISSTSDTERSTPSTTTMATKSSLTTRLGELEQRVEQLEQKSVHVAYREQFSECHGTCNTIITFDRLMVDIGRSKLNIRTGVWTAGLDGLYSVSWSMKTSQWGPNQVLLKKNDIRMSETVFEMRNLHSTNDNINSRSQVIDLKKGDTLALEVVFMNGGISNTIFSVHLI